MNFTFTEPANEITKTCFNWCKEQTLIYQNNLAIQEKSFIVIALVAVVAYYGIANKYNYFSKQFNENLLLNTLNALLFLIFMMLIMFIIYIMWLR